MLEELHANRLTVELFPAREGPGCIRVAVHQNPAWYRALCSWYPSSRKRKNQAPDTAVRRANITAALLGLISGRQVSRYSVDLLALAQRIQEEQHALGCSGDTADF